MAWDALHATNAHENKKQQLSYLNVMVTTKVLISEITYFTHIFWPTSNIDWNFKTYRRFPTQSVNTMWIKLWFRFCSLSWTVEKNLIHSNITKQTKKEKKMKLKVFQQIQQILAVMGFAPNQQQNNRLNLNYRQIIFVFVCGTNVTFLSSYIFLVANDIEEYMDAIFSLIVLVTIAIAFISIIFKNDQLFNYIECLTKELTDSKYSHVKLNAISNSEKNS